MVNRTLYKNTASLLVSTVSLFLSFQQKYHSAGTIISFYVVTDLFFVDSLDIALHHLLAAGFIASVRHLQPENYLLEAQTIVNVEASTIFLTFSHLMKAKILVVPSIIEKANQYLFLLTFTKFRIWDFYWVLLNRKSFPSDITLMTLWGLYLLNLYWYTLIIRKVMKSLHIFDLARSTLTPAVCDPCFSGRNAS